MAERAALRGYDTTLDRAGLALGAGALLGGGVAMLLVAAGGATSPLALLLGFVIGTIVTAIGGVAIGGLPWLLCHALGRRGPIAAMTVGGAAGFALLLGGQTYGFGLAAMPPTDRQTLLFRWASALATSLILAVISAAIGLAMWRVAYRRTSNRS